MTEQNWDTTNILVSVSVEYFEQVTVGMYKSLHCNQCEWEDAITCCPKLESDKLRVVLDDLDILWHALRWCWIFTYQISSLRHLQFSLNNTADTKIQKRNVDKLSQVLERSFLEGSWMKGINLYSIKNGMMTSLRFFRSKKTCL